MECSLWKPSGSVREKMHEKYCGSYLPVLKPSMVCQQADDTNPRNRFNMHAVSCNRRVSMTLQVSYTKRHLETRLFKIFRFRLIPPIVYNTSDLTVTIPNI